MKLEPTVSVKFALRVATVREVKPVYPREYTEALMDQLKDNRGLIQRMQLVIREQARRLARYTGEEHREVTLSDLALLPLPDPNSGGRGENPAGD